MITAKVLRDSFGDLVKVGDLKFKGEKARYWFAKTLRIAHQETVEIDKQLAAISQEFRSYIVDGKLPPEREAELTQRVEELLSVEVELPIHIFPMDVLPDDMTSRQMASLWWLLDDTPVEDMK